MKIILKISSLIAAFLFANICYAQQDSIVQYLSYDRAPCSKVTAYYLRIATKLQDGWRVKDFYLSEGTLAMKGVFSDDSFKIAEGRFYYFYPNAQLEADIYYTHGKKIGRFRTYYDNGRIKDSAIYKNGIPCQYEYQFNEDGTLAQKAIFDNDGKGIGYETVFHDDGSVSSFGKYSDGYKPDSIWTYLYNSGKPSCIESYDKGILLKRECFDEQGNSQGRCDSIVMPVCPIDYNVFISKNLVFPEGYNLKYDEVKVVAKLVINEDGSIGDISIIQKVHPAFDAAVIKAFKQMPKWAPGKNHNRPVKVWFTAPVIFKQTD